MGRQRTGYRAGCPAAQAYSLDTVCPVSGLDWVFPSRALRCACIVILLKHSLEWQSRFCFCTFLPFVSTVSALLHVHVRLPTAGQLKQWEGTLLVEQTQYLFIWYCMRAPWQGCGSPSPKANKQNIHQQSEQAPSRANAIPAT